jgi:prepilin-type N-terminal cleavage/methylation domain-containing protein
MNVQTNSTRKGFTIIEVVLVLAIAGLIFLMVFVALPALQRSQRDQARKTDVSAVASAVTSFTSNNRGKFPEEDDLHDYAETSDNIQEIKVRTSGDTRPIDVNEVNEDTVLVTEGTKCSTSSASSQELLDGTARQFTVVTKLESGQGAYFCLDS